MNNKLGWFLTLCVITCVTGVFFDTTNSLGLFCGAGSCYLVYFMLLEKRLKLLNFSTWFLLKLVLKVVFLRVHVIKLLNIDWKLKWSFFSWTSVIYQLYVVFLGLQKGLWFQLYTVSFAFDTSSAWQWICIDNNT